MLRLLVVLAAVLVVFGCVPGKDSSSPTPQAGAQKNFAPQPGDELLPVIDVHTHTRFTGEIERSSNLPVTRDEYLKEWKEAGIVAAISHVAGDGAGYNEDMKARNVFHCFGVADKIDTKALEKGLKSRDYRCVKIYLGYIYRFAHDAAYSPVYKLAEKYDVPVVFHTGDTYDTNGLLKYSDPLTIDEVAVKFPNVTFVIAHFGNPWIQSAAEVAYKNPNVYIEGSALLIGDLKKISAAGLQRFMIDPISYTYGYIEDPGKLMYGTDWPLTGMKDYLDNYKKGVPREAWCKVFFENAIKVFRLKELEGKYKCPIAESNAAKD